MFKIEKNIKRPPSGLRKYPFFMMEVQDSFFVPLDKKTAKQLQASILGSIRRQRYPDKKFSTRSVTSEDGVRGMRCWRVK